MIPPSFVKLPKGHLTESPNPHHWVQDFAGPSTVSPSNPWEDLF